MSTDLTAKAVLKAPLQLNSRLNHGAVIGFRALQRGLVFFVLLSSLAHAEPVTFSFAGTVETILSAPPEQFSAVQVGDPFKINYTLETDTPDQDGIEQLGTFSGAVVTYEVTIGNASATTELGGVNTANAGLLSPRDTYAAVGLYEGFSTSLSFQDASGAALDAGDNLQSIDLSAFDDRTFLLINGNLPSITGSLSGSVVPEPDSAVLLLASLVFLSLSIRRQFNNG